MISGVIKYNAPVNVATKDGNVVILGEADYNSLIETLYSSSPEMKDKLIGGTNALAEDCIDKNI